MEQVSVTNKIELQRVEVHQINNREIRVEVVLSLNNRTEEVERISQNTDEAIFTAIGLATLDAIRILVPRPLECQIDYVKKMEGKPAIVMQSLLRIRESGKESFLSGNIVIGNSLYEASANSVLDALGRTLERMIELQQKRERIRSGSFTALDVSTLAVATELSERKTGNLDITTLKTQPLVAPTDKINTPISETDNCSSLKELNNLNEDSKEDSSITDLISVTHAKELYLQGEGLIRKGNYQQAVSVLRESVSLDKNNTDSYCQLGIALLNIKSYEQAEENFLKAIELNPQIANYHTELGLFYKEIGRIDKSQKSLEKAIELDLSDARAKRALAAVRELICTFDPAQEKASSVKTNDIARLNEIKNSKKNKPDDSFRELLLKPISPKMIVACITGVLILFTSLLGVVYLYNYWLITSKNGLSEKDLALPNYVSISIVQNFPSSTKGMSIKESADKYLKEQNINIYNWYAVKENKTSNYIVVFAFTKEGREQNAFWVVELEKKLCTPGNELAKQFSAN